MLHREDATWSDAPGPTKSCSRPASRPEHDLDDDGNAKLLMPKGSAYERARVVPLVDEDDPDEWKVMLELLRRSLAANVKKWTTCDTKVAYCE